MPAQERLDSLYMDLARRVALMSYAKRKKVGAVLVKDDNIISMGWNGMPAGADNSCEYADYAPPNLSGTNEEFWQLRADYPLVDPDTGAMYRLLTKPEVLHAETNCLMKLVASGGATSAGATLYVTLSPCPACAKLVKQAKISRVVYSEAYRDLSGIELLEKYGIKTSQHAGASRNWASDANYNIVRYTANNENGIKR